jgi:multidrug efflux pump subunit AcrA (membrane-fusion protein)
VAAQPLGRPELALDGEVVTLDSRISPDTRTLRVRASLDNSEDRLRTGMAFSITMKFPGEVFPAVDPLAIQWSADGAYVCSRTGGKAAEVPVRIVQRNNDAVLVDAALAPGAMVVTQGVQMLRTDLPFRFEGDEPPVSAGGPADDASGGPAPAPPSRT